MRALRKAIHHWDHEHNRESSHDERVAIAGHVGEASPNGAKDDTQSSDDEILHVAANSRMSDELESIIFTGTSFDDLTSDEP